MSRTEPEYKDHIQRLLESWMYGVSKQWYSEMVSDSRVGFRIWHEPYPGVLFEFEAEPGGAIDGRVHAVNACWPGPNFEGTVVHDGRTGLQTRIKWRN